MSLTIVLAIGADSWLFESQRSLWQSAGYFVTTVGATDHSIDLFACSDFDVVLLGASLSDEITNSITHSIRALGSRIPLIRMSELPNAVKNPSSFDWESEMLMNAISERLTTHGYMVSTRVA